MSPLMHSPLTVSAAELRRAGLLGMTRDVQAYLSTVSDIKLVHKHRDVIVSTLIALPSAGGRSQGADVASTLSSHPDLPAKVRSFYADIYFEVLFLAVA